ncbi:1,4-alpha-glucan branching protein GlgB [Candidatus Nitrospira allomarina]|jgi:1,4-alpha-glucan branching enzyme|uniref:1,4-alpha-glucan branching enzyme GlgB n=1 Tax=Candidatus Nitrospira allomarina TaxID=3020900 RepID=A0AA96JRH4_9BACT|nr:1,4-alpha-glucan branching protein GlgB [Candidatus Nitrospira allomarina]WNM56910.1 1,4-alpha-glucan branching protein GlgB [Candidatus Nitrospira allomarina]
MPTLSNRFQRLVSATEWDPFSVLGPHRGESTDSSGVCIRAFLPDAAEVAVLSGHNGNTPIPMKLVHPAGVFEARWEGHSLGTGYQFRIVDRQGKTSQRHDPYAFLPRISDFDLHLFGEGKLYKGYEQLGAQVCTHQDVQGVNFAVWAPNAKRVSVVGDFNEWDGRRHPMRSRGGGGIWELFIPDMNDGAVYKFEILPQNGDAPFLKADPYASSAELRPKTASVVRDLSGYVWRDGEWIAARQNRDPLAQPWSIYEVHLGSWRRVPEEGSRWLTYSELSETLIPYVKDMGFTHIELMPVTEHPFDGSWGYQATGYFAPTRRFGTPAEFMAFVDACHQAGIGVLMDWAPAHFPEDPHGLAWFDGTNLYDHSDPRLGFHPEWNSRIFNYGRTEVKNFLINSALSWFDRYHIDGLRVDAVASMLYLDYARKSGEWIPNKFGGRENLEAVEFLKELNTVAHQEHPGIVMIAEESTAWPGVSKPTYVGGLGFTFKWNMGWMHDTLDYFSLDPIYRRYHQHNVTFGLVYAFTENFVLPLSHDEVVHGKKSLLDKMPGDEWQRFANLRALYGHMWGHPGKKMLFMGCEIGQWWEWNHDDSLQWHLLEYDRHQGLQRYVADLNRLYASQPALHQVDYDWTGFQWIDLHDSDHSTLTYFRRAKDPSDIVVCALNLTPVPRETYRMGVPTAGYYRELLNSDSEAYGGSNMGNSGGVQAEDMPWHGQPFSVVITLPPLAAVFFKPV